MVIETERLVLRPLSRADVDQYVALHDDPEVIRFVGRVDRSTAEERLRATEHQWATRSYGMFAVISRVNRRFLGRVGLRFWPQFDETEVGWVLRRDAWGKGYAAEAARSCLAWGFASLELPYITAMIRPENQRSIRVARRLGMSRLRAEVLLGIAVDVYAISRGDWDAAATSVT